MARLIEGTARIRNLADTVVRDLNVGELTLVSWSDDEEIAEIEVSTSPWVDGDSEANYRLAAVIITVTVKIKAASWAAVETTRKALSDDLKAAPTWLLEREIEGVSTKWRVGRPLSITSPMATHDIANRRRIVEFRVKAQPTPLITGLEP